MDTSLDPVQTALLETVKHNVKLAQTLGACGFAICLWDTLAYIHLEYRIVWLAKPSSIKFSYLFTRYITLLTGVLFFIGFFATFTQSACEHYVKVFPAMGVFPILGVTLTFALRTWQLYDRSRPLLYGLLLALAAQVGGMLALSFTETRPVPIGNGIKACVPTSHGRAFALYWIFPAVNLLTITALSLARAVKEAAKAGSTAGPLDQAWQIAFTGYGQVFPVCATIICIVQIVFYLVADEMQRAICSPLSGMLMTVLACQSVLMGQLTVRSTAPSSGSFTVPSSSNSRPLYRQRATDTATSHNFAKLGGLRAFVTSQQAVDEDRTMPTVPLDEKIPAEVKKVDLAFSRTRSGSTRTSDSGKSDGAEITPADSKVDLNIVNVNGGRAL